MPWNQVPPDAGALAALDPYLEWAVETNFAYYFVAGGPGGQAPAPTVPVIIELRPGFTAEEFASGNWHAPTDWQDWMWIPPMYAHPPASLRRSRHCTASVHTGFFEHLANPASALRRVVGRAALSLPIAGQAPGPYVAPPQPRAGVARRGFVVTAIIDDGLAFAHERFRTGAQTRIEYFWNQDGPAANPNTPYGRELMKRDVPGVPGIDTLLANATYGRVVDEDQVYRVTQHIDYGQSGHKSVAQRWAHGTHAMDIACGHDAQAAPADQPAICVQLPIATTADTSGASLAANVLDALRYIVDRADRMAAEANSPALPIAVNISYGLIAGPHDGHSILEAGIDELVSLRRVVAPMEVVLPAGNSLLSRCHARFTLGRHDVQLLNWRVQPDDRTPSYVEIWLPELAHGRSQLEIQVTTASGHPSPWVREGEVYEWRGQNDVLCKVIYFNGVEAGGRNRNMVLVAIAPTATLSSAAEVAPSGQWAIRVRNVGARATIDAWIQRDDTPYGYPIRGRQSRFEDSAYRYRDNAGCHIDTDAGPSHVLRNGTINAIATGRQPVVVGGFIRGDRRPRDGRPAKYSASGPVVHPPGRGAPSDDGPDLMAVSEDSDSCPGVLAAGSRSGSTVAMSGTSVAAPQVTRRIAERMAAGQPCGRQAMFNEARNQEMAIPPPWPTPAPAPIRGGGGRLLRPPIAPVPPIRRLGS